jgi:hypothetical protein
MDYSQPYGTPTPPPNSYPRYINGNPVTGTEGSIPPATAFDEDQIEILNVIVQAGLTPSHTDLTQLWQALQALFSRRYITTDITKTVHAGPTGGTPDFPDLFAAMNWVQGYTITNTGSVTFLVGPGKWVYTQTFEIIHQNANRIFIQGAALKGGAPTPGNITCTGYSAAARAVDATNQLVYLRSTFSTELQFTSGVTGIRVFDVGCTLRYLLITGSQDIGPAPYDGRGIELYADLWHDCLAIWGFGDRGVSSWDCTMRSATSLPLVICACGQYGMHIFGGGYIGNYGQDLIVASCGVVGIRIFGGYCWAERLTVKGTGSTSGGGGNGVDSLQGGLLLCETWADLHQNAVVGYYCIGACSASVQNSFFQNNGYYGIATSGGNVYCYGSVFSGNGSLAILAQEGAVVNAIGASISGTTSPPVNTNGAANGYIEH